MHSRIKVVLLEEYNITMKNYKNNSNCYETNAFFKHNYTLEEQRRKEKEVREQKLLEEKLEKQREKELKEQQRKIEREEKGSNTVIFIVAETKCILFSNLLFRGATET